jgi:hypothetical protein
MLRHAVSRHRCRVIPFKERGIVDDEIGRFAKMALDARYQLLGIVALRQIRFKSMPIGLVQRDHRCEGLVKFGGLSAMQRQSPPRFGQPCCDSPAKPVIPRRDER